MNKIFKIIWNKTTQRLEVVSELAKSQGKAKASTDKRESLNDSGLKGFKLTQGLKPLSLLVAFAIAMPSYATVTQFTNSQNGGLNIWGSDNSRQGDVGNSQVNAAVITGAGNTLGQDLAPPAFYPYDNRQDDNSQKAPDAINIYGRTNQVNVGNKVNVFGTGNKVLHTSVGNSGTNLAINAMGNNITIMNPRRSSYFGNDIYGNSAYLGIGNELHIAAGGQAVGTKIRVAGDSMAIGSNITSSSDNNFLVGDGLKATNTKQFISGKGITSGLVETTLVGQNIKETGGYATGSFIAGNNVNLTVPQNSPANKAVVMGVDVEVTGGTKAVTIGSNVTTTSSSNSFTAGTDIITTNSGSGVTIGHNVTSTGGTNSVVIGQSASTLASNTITLGSNNATTEQTYSIAIGNNASVVNTKSPKDTTNQENGIAIGRNSVTKKDSGIALGLNAVSNNTADIVIGRNSKTTDTTNSTLSAWTVSNEDVLAKYKKAGTIQTTGANGGVVSFGSDGKDGIKRQLKNVAAGDVSATSTDAINGAQLYALAEVVKPGTLTINAGTAKVADWKANSDKTIGFESTNNNLVVSADAANGKVKFTLANDLNVNSVTANGVDIGKGNVAVNANNKKITGLADATLSTTSTDTVTGKQLYATNTNVTTVTGKVTALEARKQTFKVKNTIDAGTIKDDKAKEWGLNQNNEITFAATSALSVSADKDGNIIYDLSKATKTSLADAVTKAETATTTANAAKEKADAASKKADTATSTANAAKEKADAAAAKADASAAKADAAAAKANTAAEKANTAAGKADTAAGKADTATEKANTAAGKADTAAGKADTAAGKADTAAEKANTAAGKADTAAAKADASSAKADASATKADAAAAKAAEVKAKVDNSGLDANGQNTKVGSGSTYAGGSNATAIGGSAKATKANTTAVGQGSEATEKGATAIGQGAKAAGENAVAIGTGSVAGEAHTVSVGSQGNERRITNVAAGRNPTDAANVGQIYAAENRMNNKLGKLDKKLRGGIANAVAVANIPQVTIPGANMVAVGAGNYKGQSAVAVGYSRASDNNRVIIKMSAGASTQRDYTFGAGIGYQW